jgi:hypothetical protein
LIYLKYKEKHDFPPEKFPNYFSLILPDFSGQSFTNFLKFGRNEQGEELLSPRRNFPDFSLLVSRLKIFSIHGHPGDTSP